MSSFLCWIIWINLKCSSYMCRLLWFTFNLFWQGRYKVDRFHINYNDCITAAPSYRTYWKSCIESEDPVRYHCIAQYPSSHDGDFSLCKMFVLLLCMYIHSLQRHTIHTCNYAQWIKWIRRKMDMVIKLYNNT